MRDGGRNQRTPTPTPTPTRRTLADSRRWLQYDVYVYSMAPRRETTTTASPAVSRITRRRCRMRCTSASAPRPRRMRARRGAMISRSARSTWGRPDQSAHFSQHSKQEDRGRGTRIHPSRNVPALQVGITLSYRAVYTYLLPKILKCGH